jgi:hypothetical protein
MGCNSSKPAVEPALPKRSASIPTASKNTKTTNKTGAAAATPTSKEANSQVYNRLMASKNREDLTDFWSNIKGILDDDVKAAAYKHPKSKRTPLHLACSLIDPEDGASNEMSEKSVVASINAMIRDCPKSVAAKDSKGKIPLHYVICRLGRPDRVKVRAQVVRALVAANEKVAKEYFSNNNTVFDIETGGVTPLYHVLQTLPDDCKADGATVAYVSAVQGAHPLMVGISNASDGDKPLCLLYRRFTRQFDLSEKFFTGDNSRPEVVDHRRRYKMAAGNTWKIIEVLLRPQGGGDRWQVVHRAIQVETPPDLLRYIVETNSEELTQADDEGNLPLHYAAKSLPQQSSFPAFYSKYVIDELLYKFPEAAGIPDGNGQFPLSLAVQTGKQWIGGGVKSLYDAYPGALEQVDLDAHASLRHALSFGGEEKESDSADADEGEEVLTSKGIVRDEHHDAIMMIQKKDIDIVEIISAMWAHEEDAGIQMLSCLAIGRHIDATKTVVDRLRIALSTVNAIVNAMKAHPNEPVVQEKACAALKKLACADGDREVSFVAAGAIAAIVGAMQAHISDATVQEESCAAIAEVIRRGGSERATVVASVSGITAIINAIASHQDDVRVQLEACRALKHVTDYPHANVPDLSRSQLEPLLQAAKQTNPACAENADILLSRLS